MNVWHTRSRNVEAFQIGKLDSPRNLDAWPDWARAALHERHPAHPGLNVLEFQEGDEHPAYLIVRGSGGEAAAEDGDWIVRDGEGHIETLADEEFAETYSPGAAPLNRDAGPDGAGGPAAP